ncbi:hypothetical protein K3718_14305 [Leisingera aquaemixtae]|uniref:Uncharacterized protein n=1 Tax=Leisingera aquaemixtae TaxID=1396826 RepID=A0ABY5WGX8_9RHOB|nr:hypothetical protein [Leisingera aquaemixtae]UWQ40711.1 hypothetical protein K3718_14305 [Leisingera aquaemixtae]
MESLLRKLVERHPEKGPEIIRLAGKDSDFLSVCEEICMAEKARGRWEQFPARAREYEEILKDLHHEFWMHLQRSTE